MLPSPASKRAREASLPVVIDFLLAISMYGPPTGTVRAGNSQHRFRDPSKAEIKRSFAKKATGRTKSSFMPTLPVPTVLYLMLEGEIYKRDAGAIGASAIFRLYIGTRDLCRREARNCRSDA
jgi:hypothetical protein